MKTRFTPLCDQDDNSNNEISSIEVKSYEEIQKTDLPKK